MVSTTVDRHLDQFSGPQADALEKVRQTIRAALPGAEEIIAYKIPTFAIDGMNVFGFNGFKTHNSLFPYGGQVIAEFSEELSAFATSKGTIRFAIDEPFPAPLLKRLIRRRIEIVNEGFPTERGDAREFYDNGFLKHRGRVRDGAMQGHWEWFRRDGTLRRSGSFTKGERTGTWITYDRDGAIVTSTEMGS